MHRIFALLALGAAGFGAWVLFTGPEPAHLDGVSPTASGAMGVYSGWAIGLLMGLALAWLAGIDWENFPEWMRRQRRRLALLVIGGACASVLLLF